MYVCHVTRSNKKNRYNFFRETHVSYFSRKQKYFLFQRRQEELERRAQELERREAELRNAPTNGNNHFSNIYLFLKK